MFNNNVTCYDGRWFSYYSPDKKERVGPAFEKESTMKAIFYVNNLISSYVSKLLLSEVWFFINFVVL